MHYILGIDPGLANCGWALYNPDGLPSIGTWYTKKLATSHALDLDLRLNELTRRLKVLDSMHPITRVCIEAPLFFGPRARDLGVVWGALVSAISHRPVVHVTPKQIRNHFLPDVKGKITKTRYHGVLKEWYPSIVGKQTEHSMDALAVALAGAELPF